MKRRLGLLGLLIALGLTARFGVNATNPLLQLVGRLSNLSFILYWPGYFFNRLFLEKKFSPIGQVALDILSSIAVGILLTRWWSARFGLNTSFYLAFICFDLLLAVIWLVAERWLPAKRSIAPAPWQRRDYLIMLAPIILFGIVLIIRPYISEGDTFFTLRSVKESLAVGHDLMIFNNRPALTPYLSSLYLAFSRNDFALFKLVLPGIFYVGLIFFYDILRQLTTESKKYWAFLLLLTAPVIMAEVDIARAQSFVIALTWPILGLLYLAIKEKSLALWFVAFVFGFSAFLVHDIGAALLLAIFAALIALAVTSTTRDRLTRTYLIGALLIAVPYFTLASGFLADSAIAGLLAQARSFLSHGHWQWWFLNHYRTVDGAELGWTGLAALEYYLFNGLPALVFFGYCFFRRDKIDWRWEYLPFYVLIGSFLLVAEVLPRFGLFYYPNRAWPHLMLAATALIALVVAGEKPLRLPLRAFGIVTLALVGLSIVGWFLVTTIKGGVFSAQDNGLLQFVQQQPKDTLIVSPQAYTGVWLQSYTGYDFNGIGQPYSRAEILSEIDKQNQSIRLGNQTLTQEIITYRNGQVIGQEKRAYTPPPTPEIRTNRPIYLIYSFALFQGIYGNRDWLRNANDYADSSYFTSLASQAAYYDGHAIAIKLQ